MPIPYAVRETGKSEMRLVTIRNLAELHPGFTEPAIRALLQKANDTGLDQHVFRIGRRILIDAIGFEDWVRGGRNGQ
jgi:hypothetical protein